MGVRPMLCFGLCLLALIACTPDRPALNGGPVLLQENTLSPMTASPTRILSPTPTPLFVPVATETSSVLQPTQRPGAERITPTLPPSKTPTRTSTPTRTPSATFTPSVTPNVSLPTLPPTLPPGVIPIPTAISTNPPAQNCTVPWFFSNPLPSSCPLNPPLVSPGSLRPFQGGYMIWVGTQDAIYALYLSGAPPRWQVFNDTFQEGMPETDANFDNAPLGTWQPRRGFGLIWRSQPGVKDRLGWALSEDEVSYTVQVQIGSDGMIYMNEPGGSVFSLSPTGNDWKQG